MNDTILESFHTILGVAERLQVSVRTVRRWIDRGDLIAHKLGAQWRVSEADLELFLRTCRGANLADTGGKR